MIATTVDSVPCWLAVDPPNWSQAITADFSIPAATSRGLTGREARRPAGETLRTRLSFAIQLDQASATRWRNAWQVRQAEPILVPFWPGVVPYLTYSTAPIRGGHSLAFNEDGSYRNIFTGTAISSPPSSEIQATLRAVPLLWCRIARAPMLEATTPEWFTAEIEVEDDGPADWALSIPTAYGDAPYITDGPALGSRVWPVLPLSPDWTGPIDVSTPRIEVDVERIGKGRQASTAAWTQAPFRSVRFRGGAQGNASAAVLLRWFLDGRGVSPCWAPTWLAESRLASDAAAEATALTVDRDAADAFASNRYLAACLPGLAPYIAEIDDFDDDDINLVDPLPVAPFALPKRTTVLTTAALCRLQSPSLRIGWLGLDHWQAEVTVQEVPPEYGTPSGETHGESIGVLPAEAYLVTLTLRHPTATVEHRWTDHESDLTIGDDTWTARPVGVSPNGIRTSLALDRSKIRLRGRVWSGCPITLWLQGLEAEATIAVSRATAAAGVASDPVEVFAGPVDKVSWEGPFWELSAVSALPWYRPATRLLIQPGCNHSLFDAGCGLDRDDWECSATVSAISGDGLTISLTGVEQTDTEEPPKDDDDRVPVGWFAGGWITFGTGSSAQHRMIADQPRGGVTPGTVDVVLQRAFQPAPEASDVVALWPGCDGRVTTCVAKFDNLARFGGFPFVPPKNPSFTPLKKSTSPTGKK
jgi:hypothetical protein